MKQPMVCVFAHPDDEAFGPGGTIAKYAQTRDVYIICVTAGNTDDQFKLSDHKNLSEVRKQEMRESGQILGVKKIDFLGFDDGSLCNNLYFEVAGKIEELLKRYQPELVMTFENKGVSGHLDHIAVSLITTFVFRKLDFARTLLYYCDPKEKIAAIKDYFIYMPPGYEHSQIDLMEDIEEVWEIKVKAMKAHKSQDEDVNWLLELAAKFPKMEHFLVLKKD